MAFSQPTDEGGNEAAWGDLLRGGRALQTLAINLGVTLHATVILIVATVMPTVVADIGGVAYYAWVTMLYMIGSIIGAASASPLNRRFGLRYGYVLAGAVYLAGNVGSALAPDMAVLLVSRTIAGYGGGLILALSWSIVGELFPANIRSRHFAVVNVTWTAGAMLGPLIGGIAAEFEQWRLAFWFMVPLALIFIPLAWVALPASSETREASPFPLFRLTLLGAGVLCVGISGNVSGIGARALFLALAIVLVACTFQLDAREENRLFPSRPMSLHSAVGAGYWTLVLFTMAYTTVAIYLPLVLQVLKGTTPLVAGYFNAVLSISWSVGSIISANWRGRWQEFALVGGPVMMVAGLATLGLAIADMTLMEIALVITFLGFGVGFCSLHVTTQLMLVARAGEESITASSQTTMRSLGVAFGAAAAGLIANTAGLENGITPETVEAAARWMFSLDAVASIIVIISAARFVTLGIRRPQRQT